MIEVGSTPRLSSHRRRALAHFTFVSTRAGAWATPGDVSWDGALPASAPGTVGQALHEAGRLDLSHPPDLDAQDHWYRADLEPDSEASVRTLVCEGLATFAEIWVDGAPIAKSESMFVPITVELPRVARELVLCFRALTPALRPRKPRQRWRTRLVDAQGLRFVRTSLLGRMPGLGPTVAPVGPYRPIYVETIERFELTSSQLVPDRDARTLSVALTLRALDPSAPIPSAQLLVRGEAGHGSAPLRVVTTAEGLQLTGSVAIEALRPWWPCTHGAQPRSDVQVAFDDGTTLALGKVGFRSLVVDRGPDGAGFGLTLNGVPVFARGACFLTADFLTLGESGLRELLERCVRAGMNMLRIPGIASYAPPAFHELCDALGLMVFQDLMFANMDYPIEDADFARLVEQEFRALASHIAHRPSTMILCGGSEVEQQAAMLGLSEASIQSPLFHALLPDLARTLAPGVAYVPNTPTGGALPFHVDEGLAHYYGVGAYLRGLDDLRRSRVRFASECLAFSNVPHESTTERFLGALDMPFHHPRWKERVPRDRGVGWDFEDVRDHYLERLFGVEARALRSSDPERYLRLGQAAVGALITHAYAEFRRVGGSCRGALVFWLNDLWDGAGFGLIDARGLPKSAYYYAARAFAPRAISLIDEGLNGLVTHVHNDTPVACNASVDWVLYRDGETPIADTSHALTLPAHGSIALSLERMLGRFVDPSYAYRFGPPPHDLVVATLRIDDEAVSHAVHLPLGLARPRERELGLAGVLTAESDGSILLTLSTLRFAQCVRIDVPGYLPDDDYFDLPPGATRSVRLRPYGSSEARPIGRVEALNARSPSALAWA